MSYAPAQDALRQDAASSRTVKSWDLGCLRPELVPIWMRLNEDRQQDKPEPTERHAKGHGSFKWLRPKANGGHKIPKEHQTSLLFQQGNIKQVDVSRPAQHTRMADGLSVRTYAAGVCSGLGKF